MSCIKCRKAELTEQKIDLTADVKGEPVLVAQFPGLVCAKCGYQTIRGADMAEYMREASDVYRQKHGLLTSSEIRYRRERLDQTQDEFARHLGVGLASIKRWEMGQIQDRAMDRLIRMSTDAEEAYHNYQAVRRLTVSRQHLVPNGATIWGGSEEANTQWRTTDYRHAPSSRRPDMAS